MADRTSFLSPTGRLVWGSCIKGRDKDRDGKPYVIPETGEPRLRYSFGLAVEKANPDYPAFLALVQAQAQADCPTTMSLPKFSWKIKDGDSPELVSKPGHAGHFILVFETYFAPTVFFRDSAGMAQPITTEEELKTGYFISVSGSCGGQNHKDNPGMFLGPDLVERVGYGEVIITGPNPDEAFKARSSYTPAGMTSIPVAGAPTGAPVAGAPTGAPGVGAPGVGAPVAGAPVAGAPLAAPVAGAPVVGAPPAAPVAGAPPAAPVAGAPGVGAPPAAPDPKVLEVPVGTEPQMTAAANGATYAQCIAKGWTFETMLAAGLITGDKPY